MGLGSTLGLSSRHHGLLQWVEQAGLGRSQVLAAVRPWPRRRPGCPGSRSKTSVLNGEFLAARGDGAAPGTAAAAIGQGTRRKRAPRRLRGRSRLGGHRLGGRRAEQRRLSVVLVASASQSRTSDIVNTTHRTGFGAYRSCQEASKIEVGESGAWRLIGEAVEAAGIQGLWHGPTDRRNSAGPLSQELGHATASAHKGWQRKMRCNRQVTASRGTVAAASASRAYFEQVGSKRQAAAQPRAQQQSVGFAPGRRKACAGQVAHSHGHSTRAKGQAAHASVLWRGRERGAAAHELPGGREWRGRTSGSATEASSARAAARSGSEPGAGEQLLAIKRRAQDAPPTNLAGKSSGCMLQHGSPHLTLDQGLRVTAAAWHAVWAPPNPATPTHHPSAPGSRLGCGLLVDNSGDNLRLQSPPIPPLAELAFGERGGPTDVVNGEVSASRSLLVRPKHALESRPVARCGRS